MTVPLHGSGSSIIASEPGFGPEIRARPWQPYLFSGAVGPAIQVSLSKGGIRIDVQKSLASAPEEVRAAFDVAIRNPQGVKVYSRAAPRLAIQDQFSAELLAAVADDLPAITRRTAPRHTDELPAAYTYLGQFIAHELSNLAVVTGDGSELSARTAALDLDTLFDPAGGPKNAGQHQHWFAGVGVGSVREGQPTFDDLPRAPNGAALTPESRNDANLAVAQLHLAFTKFHQIMAARRPADARRRTRRHIHSLVWSDYVRRICDPDVYRDITDNGRRVVFPGQIDPGAFVIPIEFAAACFRIGHAMPRETYREWESGTRDARLEKLLYFTGDGHGLGIPRFLPAGWKIDWQKMLGDRATPMATLNKSGALGLRLAEKMHSLPPRMFGDDVRAAHGGTPVLSEVTLWRGRTHELPSAQGLAAHIQAAHGVTVGMLPAASLSQTFDAVLPSAQGVALQDGIDLSAQTPLWLYCLIEAQETGGGQRLGPLASRIVGETIHAAIAASEDSIISGASTIDFGAAECITGEDSFDLHALIAVIANWRQELLG